MHGMTATEILRAITDHFASGGERLNATSPLIVAANEVLSATPGDALRPMGVARVGLTQAEKDRRRNTLGSSEIAAVLGVSPYQSQHTVWSSKCLGQDFEGNEATHLGNMLEPAIFELYVERYSKPLVRGEYTLGPEPWMSCTPDALIVGEDGLVEAKLVGLRSIFMWGFGNTDDAESDAVPIHYLCQALWQLIVTGRSFVDVAALLGTEFRTYRIHRNEPLMQTMVDRGRHFWNTYVRSATPPPVDGSEGSREMLKLLYPRSGAEPLPADPELEDLAAKLAEARRALDAATEEKRLRENEIKARLKDARGAFGKDWRIRYTQNKNGARPFVFEYEKETA